MVLKGTRSSKYSSIFFWTEGEREESPRLSIIIIIIFESPTTWAGPSRLRLVYVDMYYMYGIARVLSRALLVFGWRVMGDR